MTSWSEEASTRASSVVYKVVGIILSDLLRRQLISKILDKHSRSFSTPAMQLARSGESYCPGMSSWHQLLSSYTVGPAKLWRRNASPRRRKKSEGADTGCRREMCYSHVCVTALYYRLGTNLFNIWRRRRCSGWKTSLKALLPFLRSSWTELQRRETLVDIQQICQSRLISVWPRIGLPLEPKP